MAKAASQRSSGALPARRPSPIGLWMLAAIALVTGLAWWDEQREAEAALHDLESEQSVLAWSVAGTLHGHLTSIQREAVLVGEHGPGELGDRYTPVVVRGADAPRTTGRDPICSIATSA